LAADLRKLLVNYKLRDFYKIGKIGRRVRVINQNWRIKESTMQGFLFFFVCMLGTRRNREISLVVPIETMVSLK